MARALASSSSSPSPSSSSSSASSLFFPPFGRSFVEQVTAAAFLLILILSPAAAIPRQSKSIHVQLQAKWQGTPLLFETLEFLNLESSNLVWDFIRQWEINGTQESPSANQTDKECFHRILDSANGFLGSHLHPLLQLSLALRTYSPKVVLYRQLASDALQRFGHLPSGEDIDRWTVNSNPEPRQGICCWVDVGSDLLLNEESLDKWLESVRSNNVKSDPVEWFDFDYVYPNSKSNSYSAILYGSPGTTCFRNFFFLLEYAAKEGLVRFGYRPTLINSCLEDKDQCSKVGSKKAISLGGYGAELALKNMEYKAIDDTAKKSDGETLDEKLEDLTVDVKGFNFSRLLERKPELSSQLLSFRDYLISFEEVNEKISIGQLKDLGFQASQKIILSPDPLKTMQTISENFPSFLSSLSRLKLNRSLVSEIESYQETINSGRSIFTLNGFAINIDDFDLFSLLAIARKELSLAHKFSLLNINPTAIRQLFKISSVKDQSPRIDYRQDSNIFFRNDIEKDSRYRSWRNNIQEILMVYPGQMPHIRKNLFNAIYILDPITFGASKIFQEVFYYYKAGMPLTLGFVFVSDTLIQKAKSKNQVSFNFTLFGDNEFMTDNGKLGGLKEREKEDASSTMIKMFLYLKKEFDLNTAFEFLEISSSYREAGMNDFFFGQMSSNENQKDLTLEEITKAFFETIGQSRSSSFQSKESILNKVHEDTELESLEQANYVLKLGLDTDFPCLLFNGQYFGPDKVENSIMQMFSIEMQEIQKKVYFKEINSKTHVLNHILESNSVKRFNPKILNSDGSSSKVFCLTKYFKNSNRPEDLKLSDLKYLHHPGTEDEVKAITHWLILDFDSIKSFDIFFQALKFLENGGNNSRIAILQNPSFLNHKTSLFPTIFHALLNTPTRRSKLVPFLKHLFLSLSALTSKSAKEKTQDFKSILQFVTPILIQNGLLSKHFLTFVLNGEQVAKRDIKKQLNFVSSQFGILPGTNAIVTNGRLLLLEGSSFFAEDFELIEYFEEKKVKRIQEIVSDMEWKGMDADDITSDFLSSIIMASSSVLSLRSTEKFSLLKWDLLKTQSSEIAKEERDSVLIAEAIIDPLSAAGQTVFSILNFLNDWFSISYRILMHPKSSLSEIPLQNFYRFALPKKDDFLPNGELGLGPEIIFSNLPQSRVLTLNLKVPETWLVESIEALHDLDNLILKNIPEKTIRAVYELEAFIVNGHCYEDNNEPPRGLQLILGTQFQPHMEDTIVMSNLGYFQLKASPGVWRLSLAEGRSSEIYTMVDGDEEEIEGSEIEEKKKEAENGGEEGEEKEEEEEEEEESNDSNETEKEEKIASSNEEDGELNEEDSVESEYAELEEIQGEEEDAEDDVEEKDGFEIGEGEGLEEIDFEEYISNDESEWKVEELETMESVEAVGDDVREPKAVSDESRNTKDSKTTKVVVKDFSGEVVRLIVMKKEGMEYEDVLDLKETKGSKKGSDNHGGGQKLISNIQSKTNDEERAGEKINIFSIASGHLYERFTKIMILSVIKNTKRPVKFWFIKNYLSPEFKSIIPKMAQHYGFEVELITYKWPSWLHKQTEKQRIIWAYKILFLDVLFPIGLKKVIFVDADQIVRSNMGELYDMNLRNAPLAYTPMCDTNLEMEGYRFWKQGFWRDHLGGKPYHISALYVVDLVRFRQMAAGDSLRVFYENLSKDPNSLANLDQDLPNYAQHQVPIFSLPQNWLWCESWCGNSTKAQAKTIDLCNNPMTKEPKLLGARRIVAEWSTYDEEQKRFTEEALASEILSKLPHDQPINIVDPVSENEKTESENEFTIAEKLELKRIEKEKDENENDFDIKAMKDEL